jgi:hypothetical protein
VYGQINIKNSPFNRFSGTLVDGRFISRDGVPFNIEAMYGVVIDDLSPYCSFDFGYQPQQMDLKNPQSGVTVAYPRFLDLFKTTVNDHTSVYKVNNQDWISIPATQIIAGTNATAGAPSSAVTRVDDGNGAYSWKAASPQTVTTSTWWSNRFTLNLGTVPTGKTRMYLSYESKAAQDMGIIMSIGENSTIHSPIDETNVKPLNVNHNIQWIPGAIYKNLLYSNESGFQVYVTMGVGGDVASKSVNTNDLIAFVRNIRVSFA